MTLETNMLMPNPKVTGAENIDFVKLYQENSRLRYENLHIKDRMKTLEETISKFLHHSIHCVFAYSEISKINS